MDILFELTEADLKELGFSLGDRKRFLKGLKTSKPNEASSSISQEEQELLDNLPYVIAYPLKVSLEETHA